MHRPHSPDPTEGLSRTCPGCREPTVSWGSPACGSVHVQPADKHGKKERVTGVLVVVVVIVVFYVGSKSFLICFFQSLLNIENTLLGLLGLLGLLALLRELNIIMRVFNSQAQTKSRNMYSYI
jgi:hypothetical protein